MIISSIQNAKVKYWNKLHLKKFRDIENKFLVEGDHLVNIALENNAVEELLCLNDQYSFSNKYIVSEQIMRKLSNQDSSTSLMAVCRFQYQEEPEGNVLLIDRLQDPGNLGTIIRSAVAFNFKTIVLSPGTVDLLNEKTVRASEGGIFNLCFMKSDLNTMINKLKEKSYYIVGTDVHGGQKISKKDHIAIIIGNEGSGMNESLKSACDELVHIKMNQKCESLNAGVAASILMYEVNND